MGWIRTAALATCLLAMPLARGAAACLDLESKVVMMDREGTSIMFVSQRKLNEADWGDIGLTKQQQEVLQSVLGRRAYLEEYNKRTGRTDPLCLSPRHTEWRSDAQEIGTLVKAEPLVILGRVVQAVPGWEVWGSSPIRMVYVEVESVLRNEGTRKVQKGDLLAFREGYASIEVKGERICHTPPEGFLPAQERQQLLILGRTFAPNPEVLVEAYVFPVAADKVSYKFYPGVKNFSAVRVDQLFPQAAGCDGKR